MQRSTAFKSPQKSFNSAYSLALDSSESLQADAVILATPAYITADLMSNLDSGMAEALRALPYT